MMTKWILSIYIQKNKERKIIIAVSPEKQNNSIILCSLAAQKTR